MVESDSVGVGAVILAVAASLSLMLMACAQEDAMAATSGSDRVSPEPAVEDLRAVSPVLNRYRQEIVLGKLWKRPDLSPRDRNDSK